MSHHDSCRATRIGYGGLIQCTDYHYLKHSIIAPGGMGYIEHGNWQDRDPSASGKDLHTLKPAIRAKDRQIYNGLTPSERSVLFQARTNKIGLNGWLAKVKRTNTDRCPRCRGAPETRHHVIITCPAYQTLRARIWGDSQSCPRNLDKALGDPKHTLRTARFLLQTKRLAYLAPLQLNGNGDSSNHDDAGGSGLTSSAVG